MSLQLLAENAIKHGVSKNKMGGKFHIFAYKVEGNSIFGVRNTSILVMNNTDKNKKKELF